MASGRGVITTTTREKGEFLLVYRGEVVTEEERERREEKDGGTGYLFFYKATGKQLCVDATEESPFIGRFVNHGNKSEKNAVMKTINDKLCLFSIRFINAEKKILYDYGIKEFPWETTEKKPQQTLEGLGLPVRRLP